MQCPVCAAANPDGTTQCVKCRAPLHNPQSQDTPGEIGSDEWASAASPEIPVQRTAAGSDDLPPGTELGERYEILQLLGRGGMGAVYKARDKELDRFVALKLIRSELARNPEILRRFKQELILARQITHKNVIRIFDLGQAGGVKFITMDFVEGQDLKALLQERGKLPAEEAARIMLQLCRALQAAHSEGVIHRDLKPQNIMLDAKGRVSSRDDADRPADRNAGLHVTGTSARRKTGRVLPVLGPP